jgi:pseudouridine kinase
MGSEGIYVHSVERGRFLPVIPAKRVLDVTGAGDALVAGYAYAMLSGASDDPALYGLAAASLTVETENSVAEDLTPGRLLERLHSSLSARPAHESIS